MCLNLQPIREDKRKEGEREKLTFGLPVLGFGAFCTFGLPVLGFGGLKSPASSVFSVFSAIFCKVCHSQLNSGRLDADRS